MKKIVIVFLAALLSFPFAACSQNGKLKIHLESELVNGAQIAYSEEIDLPLADVRDENNNTVSYDVNYTVITKAGKRIEAEYPSFSLAPGDYTIEYYYENAKLKETRSFSVVDNEAPVISFDNVPRDLFLGEQESGSLPGVSIDEASELSDAEYKLYFTDLSGNKTGVNYNVMNETYPITEGGYFEYVVKATDASGNSAQESVNWMVKDSNWQDTSLTDGYLGDFGESGYRNYIRSGDVSPWWNINGRYQDEWLEVFEGANGVSKIDLEFTASGHTCINVKLAKAVTSDMLKGKCIAVRAYVTGKDIYDSFGFAGIQKQNLGGEITAATINKPLKKGEWQTYYLTAEELRSVQMYSVSGNQNSDITNLQFCFSKDGAGGSMSLYIDSISLAKELDKVSGVSIANGKVSWNAVDGASKYEITTSSETTNITETSYTLSGEKGLVSIRALGNGVTTLDSQVYSAVYGLKGKNGQVASFDDELYTYLISNQISLGAETSGYTVKNLAAAFNDGKITATFGAGGWGICSAIKVIFPESISANTGDTIKVKMNIETSDSIKEVIVNNTDTVRVGYDDIHEGSYEYSFTLQNSMELDGLQFLFITTNGSSITNVKITFEYIELVKQ